ncbi:MAG: demethoxyubiquinone hydroxylase family protein [Rhizomicrobium sp.]
MSVRRGRRPLPPGIKTADDMAAMIRVDHAGEYGAVRIYEGQLAVLEGRTGAKQAVQAVRKMARQEHEHLKAFDRLINERRVRPTALVPVWHVAGFALGAASALLGEKAAMACTAAVEEVIDQHYARQIERIEHDDDLKSKIVKFRAEEIAHRDEALAHGAEQAPAYRLLSATVKAGCRLAIKISERL